MGRHWSGGSGREEGMGRRREGGEIGMGCGGTYRYGYMARSRSEKEICRVTKREERGWRKGEGRKGNCAL